MKTLKTTLSISFILLLLLNFASCKKDKKEVAPTIVTADDLLAYNILVGLQDVDKLQLRLFSFAKVGNEVVATLDGITSRRTQNLKVTDNSFSFDTNGDGRTVYTLAFTKNHSGKIEVSAYKYYSLDNPTYKISAATVSKLTDIPSVKNKVFKTQDGVIIKFNTDTWLISGNQNTGSFYEISPGAWKGKLDGSDYMGVSIVDNDNQITLGIQSGDNVIAAVPN